jgi:hypothetical protein
VTEASEKYTESYNEKKISSMLIVTVTHQVERVLEVNSWNPLNVIKRIATVFGSCQDCR